MQTRTFFATLGLIALFASFAAPIRAELVGYWAFDGNGADQSVFGNNGTVGSSVAFSTDVASELGSGQSAVFNGTNSAAGYVSVINSPSLQAIKDGLTVSFWIKADAAAQSPAWARIIRKGAESSSSHGWLITQHNNLSDTLIRYDTAPEGTHNQNRHTNVGLGVLDNQWHHVVYMADHGTTWEFVDGVLTQSATYPHGAGLSNTEPLLIGGRISNMFRGQLDDVAIWDQIIPLASIEALAAGNVTPLEASIPEPSTVAMLAGLAGMGLVGYFRRRRS